MNDEVPITVPSEDAVDHDERRLIDPETGWNRLMVDQMARDITIAHEVNARSWSLMALEANPDDLILSVGGIWVARIAAGLGGMLLIDANILPAEQRATFSPVMKRRVLTTEGMQSASDIMLSSEEIPAALLALSSNHEQLVRAQAGRASRETQPNGWHQSRFVDEVGRIAGVSIPQPGYIEELREHPLQTPSAVTAATSKLFEGVSTELLRHLAEDIQNAHSANPNAWALFRITTGGVILVVEAITTSYLRNRGGGWILQGSSTDPQFSSLGERKLVESYRYFPGFWVEATSRDDLLHIADAYQREHSAALRHLASLVKTRTQRATSHQPSTLQALEQALGIDLPRPGYEKDILTLEASAERSAAKRVTAERLAGYFAESGLRYGASQIATFYTALQTKGFVVLSGISGTGKSKIAQGFVDVMPASSRTASPVSAHDAGLIKFTLKPYTIKYNRVILPARQVDVFPEMEPGTSVEVPLHLGPVSGVGRVENRVHTNGGLLRILYFRKDIAEVLAELPLGQEIFLDPEIEEDGQSISRIEILTEPPGAMLSGAAPDGVGQQSSNHLFLSVRPDWRDSTSLLGYFNPLTQTYEWTDFLRFILRAVESYRAADGLAWFVILDEMNLAHVEYYFADLLSVLESGRDDALHGFTREPLRTAYPDTLDDEVPPREIRLPPNLYIIGTVNMDETTHAFSPKVLDRAFTIDLTDVSFEDYPPLAANDEVDDLSEADKHGLLAAFTRDGRFHGVDKEEVAQAVANHPEIRDRLDELNRLLMKDRFHFGYRIFDEICQYIVNNDLNRMMSFENAFDQAVFMKVLPKFSGSRARLRSPLISVLAWAIDPDEPLTKQVVTDLESHLAGTSEGLRTRTEAADMPTVARRALEMLERVEMDGFVSFG